MDDRKLEELKKQTEIDNSRLEELLEEEVTPQMQMEFFETLKDSYLYLPVTFSDNMFEGIEDSKPGDVFETTGREGFDINYLKMEGGNRAVPLFTSDEAMRAGGLKSSVMIMHASDIVDMLKDSERYAAVAINPFTEHDIFMPFEAFVNMYREMTEEEREFIESMNEILEALRKHPYELEEKRAFVIRSEENFMRENAVDAIFTPTVPLSVSTDPDFQKDLKYTNILLFDEGKKVLPIANAGRDEFNTVIAPGTELKLEKELDEFTAVWKCGAQPFYDE
jgi:hypothetical protein